MQFSTKTLALALVLQAFGLQAVSQPEVILKSIKNSTGHDIVFMDRYVGDPIHIPANQTVELNMRVSQKNIVFNGSLSELLAQQAQYVARKIDRSGVVDQEVYINMNTLEGGKNDGSGIITGSVGSTVFKFLAAGSKGGTQMSSGRLKNNATTLVEVNLEFVMPETRISTKYEITEKQ